MIHRKKNKFEWIDWYCFDKQCFDLPKKFPYRKWKKEVVKKYNAYLMVNLSDDIDYVESVSNQYDKYVKII